MKFFKPILFGSVMLMGLTPLTVFAESESQSLEKNSTISTTVSDDTATRTRVWQKRLGTGETAQGASVETLAVDENGQRYARDSQRTTLNGQTLTGSISDQIAIDGDTTTRNYDRTLTNQSAGQSISRTRETAATELENGVEWTRDDSITTAHNGGYSSSLAGSVRQNEDGSVTYQKNRTVANQKGESVTQSKTVDVVRNDDGSLSVNRNKNLEGSGGQSYSKEQQGELVRNADGSGSYSRTTHASATDADGVTRSAQSDHLATWQHNEDGGRTYERSRSASTSEGRSVTSNTTARSTRDGNGNATFESLRDRTSQQGTARIERRGSRQVDGGAVTREHSKRRIRN